MKSYSSLRADMSEYVKKRNAIVDGICNIIVANQVSYGGAEIILEDVRNELKGRYVLARPKVGERK